MEKEKLFEEFDNLFNKMQDPEENLKEKVLHLKVTTLQVQLDNIKRQKEEKYEDLRNYAELIKGSIDTLAEIEKCITKELERCKTDEDGIKSISAV